MAVLLCIVPLALTLSSCSDGVVDGTAIGDSEPAAMATGVPPEMTALCNDIVAEAMTPEDASALAGERGAVTRIGSVDGEQQALTMDYRLDRLTLDVANGVVTGCTVG